MTGNVNTKFNRISRNDILKMRVTFWIRFMALAFKDEY